MKKALITGITGQDGSYLAELLLQKGYEVHGIIRRSSSFNTGRIDHIYHAPQENGKLILHYGDLADAVNLVKLLYELKPDEIYNILSLGIPLLFVGPEQSHGGDLARRLADPGYARLAAHGDVDRVVGEVRAALQRGPQPPNPAAQALAAEFSHAVLCPRWIDLIVEAANESRQP